MADSSPTTIMANNIDGGYCRHMAVIETSAMADGSWLVDGAMADGGCHGQDSGLTGQQQWRMAVIVNNDDDIGR